MAKSFKHIFDIGDCIFGVVKLTENAYSDYIFIISWLHIDAHSQSSKLEIFKTF